MSADWGRGAGNEKGMINMEGFFYFTEVTDMNQSKVVIFDFGFTLVDTADGIIDSLGKACQQLGFDAPSAEVVSSLLRVGGATRRIVDQSFFQRRIGLSREDLDSLCALHDKYLFENGYRSFRLYEGIKDVLETLNNQGYSIILVSSMDQKVVTRALEFLGVAWAFTQVVGARPVMPMKPDPAVLGCILSFLGSKGLVFDPYSSAVVGNSVSDVMFATVDLRQYGFAAGKRMLYIQANWGNPNKRDSFCEEYADAVANNVCELPDIVDSLFSQVESPA